MADYSNERGLCGMIWNANVGCHGKLHLSLVVLLCLGCMGWRGWSDCRAYVLAESTSDKHVTASPHGLATIKRLKLSKAYRSFHLNHGLGPRFSRLICKQGSEFVVYAPDNVKFIFVHGSTLEGAREGGGRTGSLREAPIP